MHMTMENMLENTLYKHGYKGRRKGRNTKKKIDNVIKIMYFIILVIFFFVSLNIEYLDLRFWQANYCVRYGSTEK